MKTQLQQVKTTLEKAETLTQRVTVLEIEQVDLRVEVQNPAKDIAAQTRIDALPAELKAIQDERDGAINALRLALKEIPGLISEHKKSTHVAEETIVREFLQVHLVDSRSIHGGESEVDDWIFKIVSNSKAVRKADALAARFPSAKFSTLSIAYCSTANASDHQHIHPPELFALANDCLANLAEI